MRALSFCIVTSGERNDQLELTLASIRAQRVPTCEIIVVGRFCEGTGHRYLEATRDVELGRIARLRNLAAAQAVHEHVVVLDDDVLLGPDWYEAMRGTEPGTSVVTPQIRLPDGSRGQDHADEIDAELRLLDADEAGGGLGPFSACGWVGEARLLARLPFDETLEAGQPEVYAWSLRARSFGVRITHCSSALVYHDDPASTAVGRCITRRQGGRSASWVRKELEGAGTRDVLLAAQRCLAAGEVAEAADCLRFGLETAPDVTVFAEALTELERAFGGRLAERRYFSDGDPEYRALVETCRANEAPRAPARVAARAPAVPRGRERPRLGVNLFGFISGNLGLGVAARHRLRSFTEGGVDVWPVDLQTGGGRSGHDQRYPAHDLQTPTPHDVNVFAVNPSDLQRTLEQRPPALQIENRINVCIPFWELPRMPPSWVPVLECMDIVVASSHFIEYALLASIGRARVRHIPQPLFIDEDVAPDRQRFGIPEGRTAFVCSFEVSSDLNRKNPFAVIEAFARAFSAGEPATLVVKINNPNAQGPAERDLARLRQDAARDGRVILIEGALSYRDVLSLYASADAYVSLHRAEGLGLGLLEAMALGKPAIATAWSGNMEFMNERTGCLVGYELVPVQAANQRAYLPEFTGPDAVWAEPSVEEAACWMRRLAREPDLRARIGAAAAEAMRERSAHASADELIATVANLLALRRTAEG